jgi:energy-coupling factor transporter ATP-binding protein EcfA2
MIHVVEDDVAWALAATGIAELHDRAPHRLSGGQRQCLAIAGVQALRRHVGMLFQSPETQLFAPTVAADVAFGPHRLAARDYVTLAVVVLVTIGCC